MLPGRQPDQLSNEWYWWCALDDSLVPCPVLPGPYNIHTALSSLFDAAPVHLHFGVGFFRFYATGRSISCVVLLKLPAHSLFGKHEHKENSHACYNTACLDCLDCHTRLEKCQICAAL